MPPGADLFVVCKQCGSEVSPYVTECPYCGNRLRRRAPKLPRANAPTRAPRRPSRLRGALGMRAKSGARAGTAIGYGSSRWENDRPYATIALVAASCAAWIAWHAHPAFYSELALQPTLTVRSGELLVATPLEGHWWRLLTTLFVYHDGVYAFVTILSVAIFGWLLERRHGPAVVLALFLGAGAVGGLVACAVYEFPFAGGGNAGALALIGAWAAPDLRAARRGEYYDGDLLGVAAIAALLLAMPFAIREASWLAGVTGGVIGLAVGSGLSGLSQADG